MDTIGSITNQTVASLWLLSVNVCQLDRGVLHPAVLNEPLRKATRARYSMGDTLASSLLY